MASLISPGIIIKERDLTTAVVQNTSASTAAFASTFARGPVGEIVTISSQKELLDTFGAPKADNAEDYFVASEFLNYGGRLAVVRAETGTNSANTGGNVALNVKTEADWDGGLGSGETFVARSPGKWGDSLKVVVVDRGPDQVLTLGGVPDTNTPVVGSPISFNTAGGLKSATVMDYDAGTGALTISLEDPTYLISTSDTLEDGDEVGTFSSNAGAPDAQRTPGTYNAVAATGGSGNGALFNVVVAGDGSATLILADGGDGYTAGDNLTIADNLLGGGGGAAIVITVGALDPDISITAANSWFATASVNGVKLSLIGPRPGTSAYAAARGLSHDEVHVAVVDTTGDISGTAGTIIERFTYLSKLSDGKGTEGQSSYYKNAINEGSQYIFHGAVITGVGADQAWGQASTDLTSGDKFNLVSISQNYSLGSGADDYAYTAGEIDAGYEVFSEDEEAVVDFVLMGGSMATETDTLLKAGSVMAVAQNRKDCIAFISPHRGNQVGAAGALSKNAQKTNTLNFFNQLASTSYAVFDSGIKYMYDRFNDVYRWIPCNGDVAGLCVSTSTLLADWYSPAGTNRGGLRNAVKIAYSPNQADRDELYQARINPIVSMTGAGVILFGDKTALASPSAFDRINVRRLFLAIQRQAETLAKGVLFEQNDSTTRVAFASALNSFMAEIQSGRGVTDFLVVCDESNNTPSVIDRNEFVAEIYVKPTRSINFVSITLTATKTGVSFSEVIGA